MKNDDSRLEANRKIVELISREIESNHDLRFHQILQNLNVTDSSGTDRWYEESSETLARIVGLCEKP